MIPDWLVYDEIKRRQEQENLWEPERLELPLYSPHPPEPQQEEERDEEERDKDHDIYDGVIIIDM